MAVENISDIHLNKVKKLCVVNVVALVDKYNHCGNAYLVSKKDMLLGLSHRTVSTCNNQDCAIHLSSAGNHVLDIVSVAGAVNVSIVTCVRFILNVSGIDCNAALSLLGSLVDHIICFKLSIALECEYLCDSSGKSGLAVVNVTDSTNVYVGLGTFKFLFSH